MYLLHPPLPGPATRSPFSSMGDNCPTPFPSGWGRGVGQMARRTSGSPRFLGGGAGARISRGCAICPAPKPATDPALNPAPLAGHPRGHPRTPGPRNFARWSARTRTRFSAATSFWSTWTRTTSSEKSRLVRADQDALFRDAPLLVHADQLQQRPHRDPRGRWAAGAVLAASSQSPIASRTIPRISPSESPSVKHPGSSGTLTE